MASEVIKLNLIPKGDMPVFHCSQFDNGRLITIELYRGEDAYEVPEGYTVELHCRKVDNNIVTLASTLVNTNVVTFTSTTQLTACNGKNLCEVAIKAADDYLIGTLNFWLEVEIDPLKGGINSTSEIHDLYDQIEDITAEVIGDNYYDKTEVDTLLDDKADKYTTYTKTQVDTLLTSKADKSNVYTKSETNTLLSAKADADDVYTKAQVETKLAAKADAASVYTKDETDTLLDAKANANAVYTKVEVDAMVDDIEDAIDLKADAATTYTKTEVDSALALKANAATTYTKTEVDTALALKANVSDVYTKAETDAAIEEAIEEILPVDTAGPSAIASFTTGLALPLVDCNVGIVATGGNGTPDSPIPINGYTEANITRCGVNLWDETWEKGAYNSSGGKSENNDYIRCVNPIIVKPNTNYYFKSTAGRICFYDETNTFISRSEPFYNAVFTTPSNCYYITFFSTQSGDYANDVSINYPSSDTTYHAYNGTTHVISFGQTVYGGSLDVTRGKLTVTHSYHTTASVSEIQRITDSIYCVKKSAFPDGLFDASGLTNLLCDKLKVEYNLTTHSNTCYIDANGLTMRPTNDYSDETAFYTAYGPISFTYPLATPIEIDLTPVQISALVGENNVFGDTNGDTTVKFKDTIQNYIDKKVST